MSSIILVWSNFAANCVSKKGQTKHGFYLIFTTEKDGALYFQTPSFQLDGGNSGKILRGNFGPIFPQFDKKFKTKCSPCLDEMLKYD